MQTALPIKGLHVTLGLQGTWHLRARSQHAPGDSLKVRLAPVGLLRFGAAPRDRRGCARREWGCALPWRTVAVCALALAARALLRRACALVMRSPGLVAAGVGGSWHPESPLRSVE